MFRLDDIPRNAAAASSDPAAGGAGGAAPLRGGCGIGARPRRGPLRIAAPESFRDLRARCVAGPVRSLELSSFQA